MEIKDLTSLVPGAKPLSHQVAGHMPSKSKSISDVFLECEDGTILKPIQSPPRGEREWQFYENVFAEDSCDEVLIELRSFLPKYLGSFSTPDIPGVRYLKLEDIAARFHKPCIVDIKMGPITYDPNATLEKISKEKAKYPPLEKVGFQLRGMRVYRKQKQCYECYGKEYLRTLNEDQVFTTGFPLFFNKEEGLRTDAIEASLLILHRILRWFESQKQLAFYASSLLLVYEGYVEQAPVLATEASEDSTKMTKLVIGSHDGSQEPVGLSKSSRDSSSIDSGSSVENISKVCPRKGRNPDDINRNCSDGSTNCQDVQPIITMSPPSVADVRMIDFAHVFATERQDDNYLMGLRSLIKYLTRVLEKF